MIRRPLRWLVDTVAVAAAATFTACYVVRGWLHEPAKAGKRTETQADEWRVN